MEHKAVQESIFGTVKHIQKYSVYEIIKFIPQTKFEDDKQISLGSSMTELRPLMHKHIANY